MSNPLDPPQKERWDRQLPQSEDAEKGMLGSILLRPSLVDDFSDLTLDIFCHPCRRKIFEVMREMSAREVRVDLITLTQFLEDRGVLAEVGGAPAITELFTFVPTAANVSYYVDIAREKWVRRRMIAMGNRIHALAYEETDSIEVLVSQCEETALTLRNETESKKKDAVQHCKPHVMAALDHIETVYQHRGRVIGLETGLVDLDRMTGGLQQPGMYVLGGLPGSGKTSAAMQIGEHVGLELGKEVLIFTQEMSSMQLMLRTLCSRAKIDLQRVRDGFLGKADFPRLIAETDSVTKSKIFLDETAGLTTAQFRARSRAAKIRNNIQLIIIDYLQLMVGVSKSAKDNRQNEIAEISRTIKSVAKELRVPIVVLAQLRRDVEDRKAPPKLSDLRESGAIGQDADLVALLQACPPPKEDGVKEEDAEFNTIMHVVKQRNGPVGEIKLKFVKKYTHFQNVTKAMYSNNQEKRQK